MPTDVINNSTVKQQPLDDAAYLSLSAEALSLMVFMYRHEDRRLLYNPTQVCAELGYAHKDVEITEPGLSAIIHPDDLTGFNGLIDKVADKETNVYCDCRFLHKSGEYILYKIRSLPLKRNEVAMLTAFNAEGTLSGEQSDAIIVKNTIDKLQHANKELEDFAYVASHDLQEPLRKISTFSDRLLERCGEQLNEEGKMYLNRIMVSAGNMRMFIDNLLEFSQINRAKQGFEKTDLNFIVRQLVTDLELVIEETGAKLDLHKLPVIDAVGTQMKQLFDNIVSNAIKFRKPDVAPVISIQSSELSAADKIEYDIQSQAVYHKIQICDNGIGFEPEYAGKIFEIFQRLHGKSEYPGTGIGLAICKKIVEYHKGILFADNNEGDGACFTIILPAAQQ